jgi:alkylhydroperoxidase family enzyme
MATRYALGRREGITEEMVAALRDYERGPFSEREKAALRYADRLFSDHHAVDDAMWEELSTRFSENELLELSVAATCPTHSDRRFQHEHGQRPRHPRRHG